jgi:glycosyltransferase involved in cell wall biosynthesis
MESHISFCLTTYNRFELTKECINSVIDDSRISEIVCHDDDSEQHYWDKLFNYYRYDTKVKLTRNRRNYDCYENKMLSVLSAESEYCVVADSDNMYPKKYIDAIFNEEWDVKTILAPSWAMPTFDYREFSGLVITKENVNEYFDKNFFSTLLNTMNFFVHREEYLRTWDGTVDPVTADSIYFNYRWLERGNKIKVVDGMEYYHRVHDGSHYINNVSRTGNFYTEVEAKIRQLK